MKMILRRLSLTALLAALSVTAMRGDIPPLPFTIKVTEDKMDKLPDYMGPGNKVDMDFPYCPVMIDGEYWVIYKNGYKDQVLRYKGANIEDTVAQPDGTAHFPIRGGYILGGMWYDAKDKTLYAPLHGEVETYPNNIRREVHLASSTDKGLTWKYEGPIITDEPTVTAGKDRKDPTADSGLYWDGGEGDHIIYVDERGGFIYLYTSRDFWPKLGSPAPPLIRRCVARCAIADRMAPGKWTKFYEGAWSQPGIGGKCSYVPAYVVNYNTFLKKYLAFNVPGDVTVCDDLAQQDWSPIYHLGDYWSFALWPTNEARNDTSITGQNFYTYCFWETQPGRRFKMAIGPGETSSAAGISSSTVVIGGSNARSMDSSPQYGYAPMLDCGDPIDARRTRRVGCDSNDNGYGGTWTEINDGAFYEGRAKMASVAGSAVNFHFKGKDIYWRTVKGPDLGKADVYLDNVLQTTVDCWATAPHPYQFGFIKRGLSDAQHLLKIVVKGEKNPNSTGTAIEHMLFEYSADTYRASDGFSSVAGKNLWTNQERNGSAFIDMTFSDPLWHGAHGSQVGYFQMTPGAGDAVRKWVAPRDGTVVLEGSPTLDGTNSSGVTISILKNAGAVILPHPIPGGLAGGNWGFTADLRSMELKTPGIVSSSYKTNLEVKAGDALQFIVQNTKPMPDPGPGFEPLSGNDPVELNSRDGKPMKIGATEFTHGLAFRNAGDVIVHLPAAAVHLGATIGLDASADLKIIPEFTLTVANKTNFKPDHSQIKSEGLPVWLDLDGATEITLSAGKGMDLANLEIVLVDGTRISLNDLKLQDKRNGTSRVLWDPVITYVK